MSRTPAILVDAFPDRDAVARNAIARWHGDPTPLEHVSTGASFTYRFRVRDERRYLRLMPPGWRTLAEVNGELAYIDHLADRGLPLARPITSASGERIERIESSIGACLALAFEAIDGNSSHDEHWSPEQAREAGKLMARAHIAAHDFELSAAAERPSWRDELVNLDDELPRDESALWTIVDATRDLFESLPQTRDGYGMVHFDLSGDNLIWNGLSPSAIDFDDCMWHWYAGDIARTTAYFRATHGTVGARETAFLRGYNEIRPLDARWRDLLPEFVRFALISELAWMKYGGPPDENLTGEHEQRLRHAIETYRV